MNMARNSRERGVILVVVLWILLAISLLAISFSASIRTEVNAARNVIEQKQGYYLARAGVEYAVYKILEGQSRATSADSDTPDQTALESGEFTLDLAEGQATIQIIDETGKVNLNLADPDLIYNLLVTVGIDDMQAEVITDSIQDWRDPDEMRNLNGAESDYYQSLEVPYWSKNTNIDLVEELLLIRGVTPEFYYGRKSLAQDGQPVEYYGLRKYFTTFSRLNKINLNSAPLAVLAAIPDLDVESALKIDELRREGPITDVSEVLEWLPGLPTSAASYFSTVRTNIFSVVSRGSREGSKVVGQIHCVVQLNGLGPKGYSVLYWNESETEL